MGRQEMRFSIEDFNDIHKLFMAKEKKTEEAYTILKRKNEDLKIKFLTKILSEYIQTQLVDIHFNKRNTGGIYDHQADYKNQNKTKPITENNAERETSLMSTKDLSGVFLVLQ